MFFRNLKLFRLTDDFPRAGALADKMNSATLAHCGVMTPKTQGWIPPRKEPGELLVSVQRQHYAVLGSEEKVLPGAVVRKHLEEKVKQIEESQGFKAGRKQIRDLKEAVISELLAKAFTKHGETSVWFDTQARLMGINASSPAKADGVIGHLKLTLNDLPVAPLNLVTPPHVAMTQWLLAGEAPHPFTIDQDCELREVSKTGGTIRYTRHSLDGDDIRPHLEAGKRVTKLALTWNDRVSFVLAEDFSIKRLSFLDIVKNEAAGEMDGTEDLMEANLAIMAGELGKMTVDLVAALGGEADEPAAAGEDQRLAA